MDVLLLLDPLAQLCIYCFLHRIASAFVAARYLSIHTFYRASAHTKIVINGGDDHAHDLDQFRGFDIALSLHRLNGDV